MLTIQWTLDYLTVAFVFLFFFIFFFFFFFQFEFQLIITSNRTIVFYHNIFLPCPTNRIFIAQLHKLTVKFLTKNRELLRNRIQNHNLALINDLCIRILTKNNWNYRLIMSARAGREIRTFGSDNDHFG